MIDRLVLLGATGDLAGRHVLPALAVLHAARKLPHRFAVVGAGRAQLDDETFRRGVAEQLDSHAAAVPATSRDATVMATRYRQVDLADPKAALWSPTLRRVTRCPRCLLPCAAAEPVRADGADAL